MEDKEIILEKKIECVIGIILLIPAIFYILALIYSQLFIGFDLKANDYWITLRNYCHYFLYDNQSLVPIFWGVLTLCGIYLIKGSFRYFFKK